MTSDEKSTIDPFSVISADDGNLSIVYNPRTDCICPPGLVGADMACRVHGLPAGPKEGARP